MRWLMERRRQRVKKNWGWMEAEKENWDFNDFGTFTIKITWWGWDNWRNINFKGWRMSWPDNENQPYNGSPFSDKIYNGWVELGLISISYKDGRLARYMGDL